MKSKMSPNKKMQMMTKGGSVKILPNQFLLL